MNTSTNNIPSVLSAIFKDLKSEVIRIHAQWILYRQLYGTNPQRIDLLNETAALFFGKLQRVLMDDIILRLSRITDLPQSCGRENMVLAQLVKKLDTTHYPDLVDSLEMRLSTINDTCKPIRKWRNRKVAHYDYRTALGFEQTPLRGISRTKIEEALKEVRDFMNEFQVFFAQSETAYQHIIMQTDGDALINALKRAFEYDLAIEQGKIPQDHIRNSKYWDA